jgi:transcriptional regulator with XRE-family HTH domain
MSPDLSPARLRSLRNLPLGRGAARWRGKLPIPQHAHPLVRQLFEEMNCQSTTMTEVAERANIRRCTMSNWRYGHLPQIDLLIAAFNVLGLELCVRSRK